MGFSCSAHKRKKICHVRTESNLYAGVIMDDFIFKSCVVVSNLLVICHHMSVNAALVSSDCMSSPNCNNGMPWKMNSQNCFWFVWFCCHWLTLLTSLINGPHKKDSTTWQGMQKGANFCATLLSLYHTSDWLNQQTLTKLQAAVYNIYP